MITMTLITVARAVRARSDTSDPSSRRAPSEPREVLAAAQPAIAGSAGQNRLIVWSQSPHGEL